MVLKLKLNLPLNAAAAFAILPQLAAKSGKKIIPNNSLYEGYMQFKSSAKQPQKQHLYTTYEATYMIWGFL